MGQIYRRVQGFVIRIVGSSHKSQLGLIEKLVYMSSLAFQAYEYKPS